MVVVGPRRTTGETVAVRVTVLLKPLVPITLTEKVVEVPLTMDWDAGVTVIVKSGGGPVVLKLAA